jgi:hypothetical protein
MPSGAKGVDRSGGSSFARSWLGVTAGADKKSDGPEKSMRPSMGEIAVGNVVELKGRARIGFASRVSLDRENIGPRTISREHSGSPGGGPTSDSDAHVGDSGGHGKNGKNRDANTGRVALSCAEVASLMHGLASADRPVVPLID